MLGIESEEGLLQLLAGFGLDDVVHGLRIRRIFKRLPKFLFVEEFGNFGEGVEVLLELALRNQEKHNQIDWLVIESIEVDSFFRAAEGADDLVDQISGGVWNANAETNPRAHRGLALLHDGGDGLPVLRFNFRGTYQNTNQLINGFPSISRLQIGFDMFRAKNVAEIHRTNSVI